MPITLPPQSCHMFLDPVMDQYVAHVKTAHADTLDFARRVNYFANKSLFEIGVSADDTRGLLLAALLRRLVTAFQASVSVVDLDDHALTGCESVLLSLAACIPRLQASLQDEVEQLQREFVTVYERVKKNSGG